MRQQDHFFRVNNGAPLNTPDPKNRQRTDFSPVIIYCLYVYVSLYWGFRLLFALTSKVDVYLAEGSLLDALTVLNLLVFILISLLAFKTFNGEVGLGRLTFSSVIAGLGMSWLNSMIVMPSLNS